MDVMGWTSMLGNVGEFVGAIAVVATLFYLAVQVKHGKTATEANTRSIDESRRLAMAETYQARASTMCSNFMASASSGGMAPILASYREGGIEALSPETRVQFNQWAFAHLLWFDNLFYQYEQGYLEADFYESVIRPALAANAKMWRDAGITNARPSFLEELERFDFGA